MKKVVCLKYKNNACCNEEEIIGFFEAEKADEFFSFYNRYAQSENVSELDITHSVDTDSDYVYLLKIHKKSDTAAVIEEKLFDSLSCLKEYIREYSFNNDMNDLGYEASKYMIGAKYWSGHLIPSLY